MSDNSELYELLAREWGGMLAYQFLIPRLVMAIHGRRQFGDLTGIIETLGNRFDDHLKEYLSNSPDEVQVVMRDNYDSTRGGFDSILAQVSDYVSRIESGEIEMPLRTPRIGFESLIPRNE